MEEMVWTEISGVRRSLPCELNGEENYRQREGVFET